MALKKKELEEITKIFAPYVDKEIVFSIYRDTEIKHSYTQHIIGIRSVSVTKDKIKEKLQKEDGTMYTPSFIAVQFQHPTETLEWKICIEQATFSHITEGLKIHMGSVDYILSIRE